MSNQITNNQVCVIIGASHAGVNCAFALRKEGWEGRILLFDADSTLPYHRPPLSKTYLTSEDGIEKNVLKSAESYVKSNIELHLGTKVSSINRTKNNITLTDEKVQPYDKLIIATGARPLIPPIPGISSAKHIFPMRTAMDAINIRNTFHQIKEKRVAVIGGGYIGLETAASLKKLGAEVTILEREERILARVTAPEMSDFFYGLHAQNGVKIFTKKNVISIETILEQNKVICEDGSTFLADMIIVGVGIRVNQELAMEAGLEIKNLPTGQAGGIKVNAATQTSDKNIYAIGDCTCHHNPHYDSYVRLESVQNAVDQAKIAAAAICGKNPTYDSIPWFWSDQYDVKLQMVGLSNGYDEILTRMEKEKDNCFSIWYFKGEQLLAVDAINFAKAYVLGTKFIKGGQKINKLKLVDPTVEFKPANLLAE